MLVAFGLVKVEVAQAPAHVSVRPEYMVYDAERDIYLDYWTRYEGWCREGRGFVYPVTNKTCWDPDEVPVKKTPRVSLRFDLFIRDDWVHGATCVVPAVPIRRRFVGINVEQHVWPEESRVWPHLGITYVGTCAHEAGYDVILWDELIQGPAPIDMLVREGDIVGLSLVTTGIERGVTLARKAKVHGAVLVIAGNDAAAFRATQLLRSAAGDIDAIFTRNSISSLRVFFAYAPATRAPFPIPGVVWHGDMHTNLSNVGGGVRDMVQRPEEFCMVPKLDLFGCDYWSTVWSAYRSQFGHKHTRPDMVRNALALFAQGCGRAGMGDICEYCTIHEVAQIAIPNTDYLRHTLEVYRAFGIDTFFNVADSSFEMGVLAKRLREAGGVPSLAMYGRAQAIAHRPDLLDAWLACVEERLLINCGMDSADEQVLAQGIGKSSTRSGSRTAENRRAIQNIRNAGSVVHLHYSLIFGSPGETHDSCKRNLEFLQWSIDTLGSQLDVVEGDIFWVNFGAPCSVIFTNYEAAKRRAALAGNELSRDEWHISFARYADNLSVPWSCEEAWYRYFTSITVEDAQDYNAAVRRMMATVPDSVTGREFAYKPPPG